MQWSLKLLPNKEGYSVRKILYVNHYTKFWSHELRLPKIDCELHGLRYIYTLGLWNDLFECVDPSVEFVVVQCIKLLLFENIFAPDK